jgi:putative transposase
MLKFQSMWTLQKFSSVHPAFHRQLNRDLHLISRHVHKVPLTAAQAEWRPLAA